MTVNAVHQTGVFSLRCLAMTLLLTGCSGVGQSVNTGNSGTQPPLAYYTWLHDAPPESLAEEQRRLLENASLNRRPAVNLVQRALLVSVPGNRATNDPGTALGLLEVALRDVPDTTATSRLEQDYLAFGRLWQTLLTYREHAMSAQADQHASKKLIQELTTKVERLEQQIEALTTIEQQLIEREQTQGIP